jgi:recombinational DNA repair ATPase RecF
MNLKIEQIKKRVSDYYFDIQQVDDTIIRFTKMDGNKPYAICYLDVVKYLPKTQEELDKYQDRVIGPYYFEGKKSLQWNNYLYFIVDKERLSEPDILKAKKLIEHDRTYARKLVISEDKLDSILSPTNIISTESTLHKSILSIWTDYLIATGLEDAILNKHNMPERLNLIKKSYLESNPEQTSQSPQSPQNSHLTTSDVLFIKSMKLIKHLDYPLQRNFEFGKVNLIVGPNGSGKTALLESIELFYCGRNRRNPDNLIEYKLSVELADGTHDEVDNKRSLSEFRHRNLIWYSQPEIKTNYLYQSFEKFNFLDTDAAARLANSTSNFKNALSKLLLGSETSTIEKTIVEVRKALSSELKSLQKLELQKSDEIDALETQIREANSIRHESDSLYTHLNEMICKMGWDTTQNDKELFASNLVEKLSEMKVLLEQALTLKWVPSPVSFDGLGSYCNNTKLIVEKVEADISQLETLLKNQKSLNKSKNNNQVALSLLEDANQLIKTDVPILLENQSRQQEIIYKYAGSLVGFDEIDFDTIKTIYFDISLAKCYEDAISKYNDATILATKQKKEYDTFNETQDESFRLAQKLREIADDFLKISLESDKCPLCYTQFNSGELVKHMTMGIDERLEVLGQSIHSRMCRQDEIVRNELDLKSALAWLMHYCKGNNLSTNSKLHQVLSEVKEVKLRFETAKAHLVEIDNKLLLFDPNGLAKAKMKDILDGLYESGYPLAEFKGEYVEHLRTQIEQDMSSLSNKLESYRKNIDALKKKIAITQGEEVLGIQDSIDELLKLKEKLDKTERIQKKLSIFNSSFPWSSEMALTELLDESKLIYRIAADLQTALSKEKKASISFLSSANRLDILEPNRSVLRKEIDNLLNADFVLQKLIEEHSLVEAMDSELQKNRASIEHIFSFIHSPAEFEKFSSDWQSLIRKNGDVALLNQISTGQRAALALSIFLSQNTQLKNGPPVILIDDPIAHIDDLNSLSFIDYMRELVLNSDRQIFFATSNEKIATLFERKFDFLGNDDFKKINLSRS